MQSDDLIIRAFDAQGNAASTEIVLDGGVPGGMLNAARLSSNGVRIVATWTRSSFVQRSLMYAVVSASSAPSIKEFLSSSSADFFRDDYTFMPVAGAGSAVLLWTGQLFRGQIALTDDQVARGVQLDPSFDAVRSGSGSINSEVLSFSQTDDTSNLIATAWMGRLAASNRISGQKLFLDDLSTSLFTEVLHYSTTTSALTSAAAARTRIPFRAGGGFGSEIDVPGHPRLAAELPNHVDTTATNEFASPCSA